MFTIFESLLVFFLFRKKYEISSNIPIEISQIDERMIDIKGLVGSSLYEKDRK